MSAPFDFTKHAKPGISLSLLELGYTESSGLGMPMAVTGAAIPRTVISHLGSEDYSKFDLGRNQTGFSLNWKRELKPVCCRRLKDRLTFGIKTQMVDGKEEKLSQPLQKDLNSLPKPLTMADLSSTSNDGSKVRIAFKGIPGAYSEDAALKAYPHCETVPCKEFEDAFEAVELWLANKAVLPIENSFGGSIHRNYDLLLRHRLHIIGEVQLPASFNLLGLPGVGLDELKRVMSHPQALAQTDRFLSKLGVVRENSDDTAAAAEFVASNGLTDVGVIAGARAAQIYGLNVLADDIQDDPDSITRFIVLARDPIIPRTDKPFKTSVVFSLEEGPGLLFKALAVFALREINLTKIESRPQRKKPLRVVDDSDTGSAKYFDYIFYIDFEASMADPRAQNALEHLQEFATFLRVLGCYPVDTL